MTTGRSGPLEQGNIIFFDTTKQSGLKFGFLYFLEHQVLPSGSSSDSLDDSGKIVDVNILQI